MKKDNLEDDDREEIGKGCYFEDDISKTPRKQDIIEKAKECSRRSCSVTCKNFENCKHIDKQR